MPAGDLLVVRTAIGSSVPVASITDAAGDVYVRQAAVSDRNDLTSELWTATVASPLAAGSPIVVSWSGISGAREAVIADDFASVTGAADGSGTANGRGSSPSATTPSITGDLVVAVTAADASPADAYTEAAGWTELGSIGLTGPGNRALSLYGGWRIAASSVTAHDPSLSASAKWTEGDVALRP